MKLKYCLVIVFCLSLALFACLAGCGEEGVTTDPSISSVTTTAVTTTAVTTTATTTQPRPKVAISFDDGPHNVRTKLIVDELAKYGYHATFFVVGNRVDGTEYNGSAALKYAIDAGCEIGIHGYTHKKYYSNCSDEDYLYELSMTENAIKAVAPDYEVKLMRPVGGFITDARVAESEYSVIMWNVDSNDWKHKYASGDDDATAAEKVDTIVDNVMSVVGEGSIVLMHDIYESTYDALVIILERLHAEGYEVVTVSELLGESLEAGVKFSKAPTPASQN